MARDPGPGIPGDPNRPSAAPVEQGPVVAGTAVKVGAGVVIFPPAGWSVVGSESGLTAFQKGGVVMIVGGIEWRSTPLDLATQYRDAWFKGGQFTGNDPQTGSDRQRGRPPRRSRTPACIESTTVDGIIVAGATGGAGVVINASWCPRVAQRRQ